MRFLLLAWAAQLAFAQAVPSKIPKRRSTQLLDGFGMNVNLPRHPRMPWTKTWAPLFDCGVKWVRIGQYENSSEKTSWDWVEETPKHYSVVPDVDEAVRSLLDNGVSIEVQLQYSNPLYAGDAAKRPSHVTPPPPGIGQNDKPVHPIFLAPKTPEQIEAFLGYVRFMVGRYKGRIHEWEFWNEANIGYWQPDAQDPAGKAAKAKWYGSVLCPVADAIHRTDPTAKVISTGVAGADLNFVKTALAACPEKIDIVAYHSYPGGPFGVGRPPEEVETKYGGAEFREGVRRIPGIRPGVRFWLNEWNVTPKAKGSNQSVQARYVPRFFLESLAHHVRGAVWIFIPATDGNEDNLMGIMEGDTQGPDAFRPREAFFAFQNLSAVFGQTEADPESHAVLQPLTQYPPGAMRHYTFRDRSSGRRVYAYWLAIPADPKDDFRPVTTEMTIADRAIVHPILMDIRTGDVRELEWKDATKHTLEVPVKDSVMAVADAAFIDWRETPPTPGELVAEHSGQQVKMRWKASASALKYEVQRSDNFGPWRRVALISSPAAEFSEPAPAAQQSTWRVRAANANGESPWSNPAWLGQ
jgi:hypothetical protein